MKHAFEYNGKSKLILVPEDAVERLLLETMTEASQKGATTLLEEHTSGFILTVGDKK